MFKNKTSIFFLFLCYLIMAYTAFIHHPRWEGTDTEATISWDASGYYMYLPAFFIYDDIKECKFKDSILAKYKPTPNFQQAFIHEPTGNYVMKYSVGQALIMYPFFLIADSWAKQSSEYLPDGFSYPYQKCIGIGMFLIALIGLFFLRKVLLHYFKDGTVGIVLLLYVIGTNYLNYSSVDQAMTHNALFTIYALLVWFTIRFYESNKWKFAILIGLLTGLATLIRPTEILSLIIPMLWGVSSKEDFQNRLVFIRQHFSNYFIAAFLFGSIVFIQPLYWHYATGEWIVYSYQDQGFSWLKPHIWDYAMSYRCGWIRYCPMMILPFLGLYFLYKKKKSNRWAVILYVALAFYITTAWDVWDYGGTGGRAMVQHYVILAFPFASLIEWINTKKLLRIGFYALTILLAYLNIWAFRAGSGNIQVMGASRQYYWATVGRWSAPQNVKKLLDNRYLYRGEIKNPDTLYSINFTSDSLDYVQLNKNTQFSKEYSFKKPNQDYEWFRAYTFFECKLKQWDTWKQTQYILKFYNNNEEVQSNLIRVHRFITHGEKKEIYLDAKPPKEWDKAAILYWNAGGDQEIKMRNVRVIGFNE